MTTMRRDITLPSLLCELSQLHVSAFTGLYDSSSVQSGERIATEFAYTFLRAITVYPLPFLLCAVFKVYCMCSALALVCVETGAPIIFTRQGHFICFSKF